jgi:hypothetical protein
MTVAETWRSEYRSRRYLEYISQDKLEQRTRDILSNVTTLTEKGQIGIHSMEKEGGYWMRLFTHVLEEYKFRGRFFKPGFMNSAAIPVPSWPSPPKSVSVLNGGDMTFNNCIFKFGKVSHLEAILNEGRLRIAQASYYSDPSLNSAIQDDELQFNFEHHPGRVHIQTLDQQTLQPTGDVFPVGNIVCTKRVPTDYWILCLAHAYPLRAYDDFEADGCLVIKEPKLFLKRLLDAMGRTGRVAEAISGTVDYLDPLNTYPDNVKPFFAKHFRFSYQKEFRVIWLPPVNAAALAPVFVTLGPLTDIAELLILKP